MEAFIDFVRSFFQRKKTAAAAGIVKQETVCVTVIITTVCLVCSRIRVEGYLVRIKSFNDARQIPGCISGGCFLNAEEGHDQDVKTEVDESTWCILDGYGGAQLIARQGLRFY